MLSARKCYCRSLPPEKLPIWDKWHCRTHLLYLFKLDNAIQHGLLLAISFLDLRNAFGSVAHNLIKDILHHIQLPDNFVSYISESYAQLSGLVKTKHWRTPVFKIERGVFQKDTLSPLIFLVAFNPLIEFCNKLPSCGFCLKLPVPNSSGLHPISFACNLCWMERELLWWATRMVLCCCQRISPWWPREDWILRSCYWSP